MPHGLVPGGLLNNMDEFLKKDSEVQIEKLKEYAEQLEACMKTFYKEKFNNLQKQLKDQLKDQELLQKDLKEKDEKLIRLMKTTSFLAKELGQTMNDLVDSEGNSGKRFDDSNLKLLEGRSDGNAPNQRQAHKNSLKGGWTVTRSQAPAGFVSQHISDYQVKVIKHLQEQLTHKEVDCQATVQSALLTRQADECRRWQKWRQEREDLEKTISQKEEEIQNLKEDLLEGQGYQQFMDENLRKIESEHAETLEELQTILEKKDKKLRMLNEQLEQKDLKILELSRHLNQNIGPRNYEDEIKDQMAKKKAILLESLEVENTELFEDLKEAGVELLLSKLRFQTIEDQVLIEKLKEENTRLAREIEILKSQNGPIDSNLPVELIQKLNSLGGFKDLKNDKDGSPYILNEDNFRLFLELQEVSRENMLNEQKVQSLEEYREGAEKILSELRAEREEMNEFKFEKDNDRIVELKEKKNLMREGFKKEIESLKAHITSLESFRLEKLEKPKSEVENLKAAGAKESDDKIKEKLEGAKEELKRCAQKAEQKDKVKPKKILAPMKKDEDLIELLLDENDDLAEELEILRTKILPKHAQEQLIVFKEKLSDLRSDLRRVDVGLEVKKTRSNGDSFQVNKLKSELVNKDDEIAQLTGELQESNRQSMLNEQKIHFLEAYRQDAEKTLSALRAELKNKEERIDAELQEENDKLKREMEEIRSIDKTLRAEIKKKLKPLEDSEGDSWLDALEDLKDKTDIEELRAEIGCLTKIVEELESDIRCPGFFEKKNQELKMEMEEVKENYKREILKLTEKLEKQSKELKQDEILEAEVDRLEEDDMELVTTHRGEDEWIEQLKRKEKLRQPKNVARPGKPSGEASEYTEEKDVTSGSESSWSQLSTSDDDEKP